MDVIEESEKARAMRFAKIPTVAVLVIFGLGAGCLNRPVVAGEPVTKTSFTAAVQQTAIDKVDVLLAIDNSASMGDKQQLLAAAVPDLIARLVTPNCILKGAVTGVASADGTCATGGTPEFRPVHDLHIGIVTSSLGGLGSDACLVAANARNDDHGHLFNQDKTGTPVVDANPSHFLAWFPDVDANRSGTHPAPPHPILDTAVLENEFKSLVTGVGETGCGFEAQLESWYRFLIQPDPYLSVAQDASGATILEGVDATILQQRHDFLRPDSLVAIIQMTDENDSFADPRGLNGTAYKFDDSHFKALRGTSVCTTSPDDPACLSCGGIPSPSDPVCQSSVYDADADNINERFFHMKQRFGADPQFPISRYVTGLTSSKVPNRDGEHPPAGSFEYVGDARCTNPLFATDLPTDPNLDLCNLTPGQRSKDLISFAVIGGVPWQLLLDDPKHPDTSAFKSAIRDSDWTAIIGKDPLHYDFTGADPHMLESLTPRAGLVQPGIGVSDTADPYNGREWDTKNADLQFACTFPLLAPRDCTDPQLEDACDCLERRSGNPPLCGGDAAPTTQLRGKAYPTIREFSVVRALGAQGIAASLCPRSLDLGSADYGYRPAVRSIVDRLKATLGTQCLPQRLAANPKGEVPCLILITLGTGQTCDARQGQTAPDAQVLQTFRQQHVGDASAAGTVCELRQLVVPAGTSCTDDPSNAGWCYVVNSATTGETPAGACSQSILFTGNGQPAGSTTWLQCIESSSAGAGG